MVDLPKVPNRLATVETPRSSLSAADIKAPYAVLAKGLDEAGDVAGAFAEKIAEQAGYRAVSIGADGKPEVTAAPIVGPAATAFRRTAKIAAMADADGATDREIVAMKEKFRGDPDGFAAAAKAYGDEKVQQYTTAVGPEVGVALKKSLESKTTQVFTGLLSEKQRLDLQRATASIDTRIKVLGDDMESLARKNGIGPEYEEKLQNLDALLNEKTSNPLFHYPKEKAEEERATLITRVQGGAILEQTERVYGEQGHAAAREYLRSAVRGLEGKVKQLDKIERMGLSWLRTEEAGFRGERDAISREWAAAKGQIATLPPEVLIDMEQRASALGASRVAGDIATHRAALDTIKQLRGLSREDQAAIAGTGTIPSALIEKIVGVESGGDPNARPPINPATGERPSSALGAAQFTKGTWREMVGKYRPELAAGKTDAELLDLRRDPALAREMTARYAEENVAALKSAGIPVTAGKIYAAHFLGAGDAVKLLTAPPDTPVVGLLDPKSIDANRTIMANNPTAGQLAAWAERKAGGAPAGQVEAGNIDLGNRPVVKNADGSISTVRSMSMEMDGKEVLIPTITDDGRVLSGQEAIDLYKRTGKHLGIFDTPENAAAFARRLSSAQGAQYGGINLTQSRAGLVALGMLKKELGRDLGQRIADFASADRKLQIPAVAEIETLGAEVHAIGTPEQKQRVAELAAEAQYGAEFLKMNPQKRAEVLGAISERLKTGATKFERELAGKLVAADQTIGNAFKNDPYGAAYRFTEGVTALPSLDFSQPNATEILAAKVAQQNKIRANEGMDAFSVFRPAEAQALATALTQGPPEAIGPILNTLRQLPADILQATVADKPIKDALDGMVRSYDPARLNAAMSVLDQQWRADPIGFKSTFKDEGTTLKRLQVWQAWKDTTSPAEIAERFKRADDPATHGARAALALEADGELKSIKVADIAYQMGTSFGIPVLSTLANPLTGATPAVPTDSVQGSLLKWQFDEIYKDLRQFSLDPEQAKKQAAERLKTEWGPTQLVNNSLMRFPPERYFPQVDGSHDWMKAQLDASIAAVRGPQATTQVTAPAPLIETGTLDLRTVAVDPGDISAMLQWSVKNLIPDQRTEVDIAQGKKPSYAVRIIDHRTGRDEILMGKSEPLRMVFDPSAPTKESEKQFTDKRASKLQLLKDARAASMSDGY